MSGQRPWLCEDAVDIDHVEIYDAWILNALVPSGFDQHKALSSLEYPVSSVSKNFKGDKLLL